jgi:hypothetical protein
MEEAQHPIAQRVEIVAVLESWMYGGGWADGVRTSQRVFEKMDDIGFHFGRDDVRCHGINAKFGMKPLGGVHSFRV